MAYLMRHLLTLSRKTPWIWKNHPTCKSEKHILPVAPLVKRKILNLTDFFSVNFILIFNPNSNPNFTALTPTSSIAKRSKKMLDKIKTPRFRFSETIRGNIDSMLKWVAAFETFRIYLKG